MKSRNLSDQVNQEKNTQHDSAGAATSSLRIPMPAMLAGLGLLAAGPAQAQQLPSPSPTAPVAVQDAYILGLNGVLEVNATSLQRPLADNDTFAAANCSNVSIELLSLPANGDLRLEPNTVTIGDSVFCSDSNTFGAFTYEPNPGFVGTDTFTYALLDGTTSESSNTTVFLTTSPLVGVGSLGAGLLAPMAALALLRRRKKKD